MRDNRLKSCQPEGQQANVMSALGTAGLCQPEGQQAKVMSA